MDWSTYYPAFVDEDTPAIEGRPKRLKKEITVADIGCGFGGLLIALSPLLPDELILGLSCWPTYSKFPHPRTRLLTPSEQTTGLEIRTQVTQYVADRICALRSGSSSSTAPSITNATTTTATTLTKTPPPNSSSSPSSYQNISALRANTMKFLPNLFTRNQLKHIFLCFPDPHFKARKHKARIVSGTLCAEYAYVLKPGGVVWTITDVEELSAWMVKRFEAFGKAGGSKWDEEEEEAGNGDRDDDEADDNDGEWKSDVGEDGKENTEGLFERLQVPAEGEEDGWPDREIGMLVKCIREDTEEGKKVTRNQGKKFVAVFRRREDPPWPGEDG